MGRSLFNLSASQIIAIMLNAAGLFLVLLGFLLMITYPSLSPILDIGMRYYQAEWIMGISIVILIIAFIVMILSLNYQPKVDIKKNQPQT